MKKITLAVLAVLLTSTIFAQNIELKPYIAGKAGIAVVKYKEEGEKVSDTVFTGSAAVGAILTKNFRIEIEGGSFSEFEDTMTINGVDIKGTMEMDNFMFNLFYTHPLKNNMEFFVGAGVGLTTIKGKTKIPSLQENDSWRDNNFTYSIQAGISLPIMERFFLDGSIKYMNMVNSDYDLYSFVPTAGLRYIF